MFEVLEHTADLGFRARAPNLKELFENAAAALVGISMETGEIQAAEQYRLEAEADSVESLLVNWLSEVLYFIDGRRAAMRDFQMEELDDRHARGTALGEARDATRHPARLIVKGVTYHQLKIAQDQQGWYCEVYLDV